MDIRLKWLFLGQLYVLPFYSKKCATDCSLIREPLGGLFSLGMRLSESLSMTTDLGLFRVILDRMTIFKSLKIKILSPILRKSVESQKKLLSQAEVAEIRQRITAGMSKAQVAREFGISRQTLYQYLRGVEGLDHYVGHSRDSNSGHSLSISHPITQKNHTWVVSILFKVWRGHWTHLEFPWSFLWTLG